MEKSLILPDENLNLDLDNSPGLNKDNEVFERRNGD